MQRIAFFMIVSAAIVLLGQCRQTKADSDLSADSAVMGDGFRLLSTNCFSCHNPRQEAGAHLVAPLLKEVKQAYLTKYPSATAFTSALANFLLYPETHAALLPDAVAKYGAMPKMGFSESQLHHIAAYMYAQPIEEADWYDQHFASEQARYALPADSVSYIAQGQQFALQTKGVLGKNLLNALQTKGAVGAVAFCNERAYPLTDSMAQALATSVRRVSDQPRNPRNIADAQQTAYIVSAKASLAKGEKPSPQVVDIDGKKVGYYPILTDKMCLQCHGKPNTEIAPATADVLRKLYPADRATGYAEGQLRGIWVVAMSPAK